MLPNSTMDNIFNITSKVEDMSIDHICDDIESYGFWVSEIINVDIYVKINFHNNKIEGQIIIDRINKNFQISAKTISGWTFLPIYGNWELIQKCLNEIGENDA